MSFIELQGFSAADARAMADRARSAADVMFAMKRCIVAACEQGQVQAEFRVDPAVQLSATPSATGGGSELQLLLDKAGQGALSQAIAAPRKSGYRVIPSLQPRAGGGTLLTGVTLNWSMPGQSQPGSGFMAAVQALELTEAVRPQIQWAKATLERIRQAASLHRVDLTFVDPLPVTESATWRARAAMLATLNYKLMPSAARHGTSVLVTW
jgi:hypothetical protein